MNRIVLLGLMVTLTGTLAWAQQRPALKSPQDRLAYSLGVDMARRLKKQQIDVDAKLVARGLRDALADKSALSDKEVKQILAKLQNTLRAKRAAQRTAQGARNGREGKAFLARNKTKAGVKTTASGLQYKVLKAGQGKRPTATNTVTVHYRGTLLDGTEFDSSHRRGQPASFLVNRVIRGWTEALRLMRVGAKWNVYIPGHLAYGARGAGAKIGPNATLIFEIELLGIK